LPKFTPKDTWDNIPRINLTARTPHGYTKDDKNTKVFVPDLRVIELLEEAMDFVDQGNSFRSVADWYSDRSPAIGGKPISHQGIKVIWEKHRKGIAGNERAALLKEKSKNRRVSRTKEEQQLKKLKDKVSGAKRSLSIRTKNLEEAITTADDQVKASEYSIPAEPKDDSDLDVVFKPNSGPQTDFLAAPEQEVLYGGAAGGGKSYAMLADPMRYFNSPSCNAILFRKTNDELRELKQKSRLIYPRAFPGAKWKEQTSSWVFPSGAQLWMTYLDRDEDVERYQGQAFTWIGFDELGHWASPYTWNYMRSRLRSTDSNIPLSQRATANPGGVGGTWIKKMFIDPAPWGEAFYATDTDTGNILRYPPDHPIHPNAPLFQRRFIPAKLSDNPYLYADGRYEASLLSLPEAQRRQLLEGDWNMVEGAAFSEFKQSVHVIEPFTIPSSWKRFRSCDYGYSSNAAVLWFAIDPVYETLILYRELYVTRKTGAQLADMILELEAGEHMQYGVMDSSVWHQRGQTGPSIAEEMIARGCRWRPSDRGAGSRTNGKNRLHELLRVRDVGTNDYNEIINEPGIKIFNTCRQLITDLPMLPSHPDGKEDIDDRYLSDHTYDALRYGIMTRPRAISPFDFGGMDFGQTYRPSDPTMGY